MVPRKKFVRPITYEFELTSAELEELTQGSRVFRSRPAYVSWLALAELSPVLF